MGQQNSQKTGLRSDAQKRDRARNDYKPIPPSNPVAGASGEHKPDRASDHEVSLKKANKRDGQSS
jgi:hypothetical protein